MTRYLRYRAPILYLCVALLPCCSPGESVRNLRLIELAGRAEIEGTSVEPSSWPKGVIPATAVTERGQ